MAITLPSDHRYGSRSDLSSNFELRRRCKKQKDERNLLEVLKSELEFVEQRGYQRSPETAWRPKEDRKMKRLKKYLIGTLALVALLGFAVVSAKLARGQDNVITSAELKELIKNAKEPADHRKIEQYFNQEADRLEAEANVHVDLAAIYRANPTLDESKHPMSGRTAGHCDYFSKVAREAAHADRQIAAAHAEMAKAAKK
jgi:hypothetical protein